VIRRALALVAVVVLAFGTVAPALGQGVDVQELYRKLRCPSCGTSLDVSSAPAAEAIKAFVREQAAQGKTEGEIKDALVAEFGREVLATPPKEGFDLLAWLVPALAVAIGLAAIPVLTRLWARRRREDVPEGPAASPEELERLQRELDRIE
jgi:cytochrome c-type biogenesis protein CcmH